MASLHERTKSHAGSLSRIAFLIGLAVSAIGLLSPPVALTLGIVVGLATQQPFAWSGSLARVLLQASVVALGFGMNLHEVLRAGRAGFLYTALGIAFALLVGLGLGKWLAVRGNSSFLISTGTAICGGSAIAAVAPILHASEEEMAVSLGTVFILNSVGLLIFPLVGWALHLSQSQFGLWAALAIHDTSSVVGAAAKYGPAALVIGTTVKLARALWIAPLALVTAAVKRSKAGIKWPWFIFFFCLAAVVNTYFQVISPITLALYKAGRLGLTATLFLIGSGISRPTLRQVGWRPLLQGVLLWIAVACASLWLIRAEIVSF
jgi:uncharacterized integral membrane protein (TIGR00698 family)